MKKSKIIKAVNRTLRAAATLREVEHKLKKGLGNLPGVGGVRFEPDRRTDSLKVSLLLDDPKLRTPVFKKKVDNFLTKTLEDATGEAKFKSNPVSTGIDFIVKM
jgi:hypothetical protein